MDVAINERLQRIELSQLQKDTDRQWDLIAPAVEEAIIKYLQLEGRQATRMRGRSRVSYRNEDREILQGADKQTDKQETNIIETLNKVAGIHAAQGNRLNNIHYRMKAAHIHNQNSKTKQHIAATPIST